MNEIVVACFFVYVCRILNDSGSTRQRNIINVDWFGGTSAPDLQRICFFLPPLCSANRFRDELLAAALLEKTRNRPVLSHTIRSVFLTPKNHIFGLINYGFSMQNFPPFPDSFADSCRLFKFNRAMSEELTTCTIQAGAFFQLDQTAPIVTYHRASKSISCLLFNHSRPSSTRAVVFISVNQKQQVERLKLNRHRTGIDWPAKSWPDSHPRIRRIRRIRPAEIR